MIKSIVVCAAIGSAVLYSGTASANQASTTFLIDQTMLVRLTELAHQMAEEDMSTTNEDPSDGNWTRVAEIMWSITPVNWFLDTLDVKSVTMAMLSYAHDVYIETCVNIGNGKKHG